MADLARIKRNVVKMVGLSAPEADIDAYIASEGVTIEDVRAFKPGPVQLTGTVGKKDPAQAGMSENVVRPDGKPLTPLPKPAYKTDLISSTAATVNGIVNQIPFLQNTSDAILGAGGMLFGQDYGKTVEGLRAQREAVAQAAPVARGLGEVAGAVGGVGALGATKLGAEALGMTGNIGKQFVNSGLSSAGLTGLNSISQGRQGAEVLGDMAVGGAAGAAAPIVMAGVRAAGRGINDAFIRPIATMANRDNAAISTVGKAIGQDRAAGAVMSSADEAVAAQAGAPVMNADRFGAATRTLARTAANVSPEAKGALQGAVEDRFLTQSTRAKGFITQLMNGATDDLALQDTLRTAAQVANKTAYDAARSNPASRAIWNQPIKELMQSPTFLAAIKDAESVGADRAAVAGVKAVRNPFEFLPDGGVTLRVNKDGSRALPSLDFWDQVKRNLDVLIEQAKPTPVGGGSKTRYADLTAIKQKLVSALDSAVPEYKKARQGAASFFGAEDAIDAGRKAFRMTKEIPELRRAHFAMNGAEKQAASVGYASEMIDAIDAAKDRVNVINSLFGSPSARARNEIFLGPQKAKELEAYVKVEQTLHMLKDAVSGNSTTAQQLIAAGVLGTGTALWTGDASTGLNVATLAYLGRRGMQMLGKKADEQVMKKVAEMLLSGDPAMVQKAIQNAALSQAHMQALEAIMQGLNVTARGATLAAVN